MLGAGLTGGLGSWQISDDVGDVREIVVVEKPGAATHLVFLPGKMKVLSRQIRVVVFRDQWVF